MITNEFKDKVIVITGGANGIGACIAHFFMESGALVVIADSDKKTGKKREQLLNELSESKRATFFPVDLKNPVEIKKFIKNIVSQYKHVDVLINNAGIFSQKPILKRPLDDWEKVIAINLRAAYLCSQLLIKSLAKRKGNIINIASTRALMSETNTEPYSASKGGLVALSHALAMSLAKYNIRVNCISPGWIETSSWQIPPHSTKLRAIDHKQHPVGRVGKPEDIAHACLLLADNEKAGFITGQNIVIDGGMTKKMIYAE